MRTSPQLGKHAYGLLGLQLVLACLPHVLNLPWPLLLVAGVLIGTGFWRWKQAYNALPVAQTRLVILVVVLATILLAWLGSFPLEDVAVAILIIVTCLKWLESRQLRDAMLASQLNFFVLLTQFLYDQPFWLGVYVTLCAVFTLRNWLILAHPGAGRMLPGRYIGRLLLYGLPMVVALFVLFPRLEHPIWQISTAAQTAQSGVSDTLSPGSLSEVVQSAAIAFRAEFSGPRPPQSSLYWRGLTLWDFDGQSWRQNAFRRQYQRPPIESSGQRTDYTITLEQGNHRWLYLLQTGLNVQLRERGWFSVDDEFLLFAPPDGRIRYQATSGPRPMERLDNLTRQLALALPYGNPRATALGAQWAARYAAPEARIQAALQMFAGKPFAYTLRPGKLGDDPVDEFLFQSQKGFCEHYASSFVFLMRAAGVPARVVVGYLGGEYNTVGNYYIIRQADAHAWAEVWLDGKGWTRVDPTAAVAPERVERGIEQVLPADSGLAIQNTRSAGWLREFGWIADNLVNQWNRWVLSYDRQRQKQLLEQLGLDGDTKTMVRVMVSVLSGIILAGMTLLLWPRKRHLSPEQRLYEQYCNTLARKGLTRARHEGPADLAARAGAALPEHQAQIARITQLYLRLRYQTTVADRQADLQQFEAAVRSFRP
ncbi:transglutaminase TgpA family protein [Leeia oryzae]|uniref:transglutaminase TgpA family protein n=1 Tax=Leeia oryzae TaxID=356662 RepID=UPI0003634A14|nr:DUF3488 and transglutaminase-like domain-containing protein [Leeia oryzae]